MKTMLGDRMTRTPIALLLVGLLLPSIGWAQGLATVAPTSVGLSEERLDRLAAIVQGYVDDQAIAGAVTLVARRGRQAHIRAYGMADREAGTPMRPDNIFRIASMTKPITSVAVLMLYEEGHFKLNDPIGQYLPALASLDVLTASDDGDTFMRVPAERPVTIRHLLTHTSGIGYRFLGDLGGTPRLRALAELYGEAGVADGLAEHDGTIEELVNRLGDLPLLHEPGAAFSYGLSDDVLGRLVEVVSGTTFDEFLRTRLFEPLGMDDTFFYIPNAKASRLASVYTPSASGIAKVDGTVEGTHLVYSSTYSTGSQRRNFSGGAGLSSTAHDYSRFLQMLLNGGTLDRARILSPMTVALMTTDHIGDMPVGSIVQPGSAGFGLGVAIRGDPGIDGELGSEGAYYWSGFFNTTFWVDPSEELIGLLMVQVFPGTSDIQERFRIMAYQAIAERDGGR
ncbi:MAG: serine hydrolase [Acidobacteria bacterium]|jgi:CubicO group peptidase (beta-lactamase class C family)|nr:serine hydrolase [Acidobacteriota bacterium]MDP7340170.1 serine hydrolase domain-containing protein [Vicinamibacterales bacterium]HJN42981.1 serine hydrolase domain-containing protein [Vicinamibacterales bacterium]|tara:strand:+ start:328 stop:1683 length:1356 start_codon:yes stop_codon:yes gene_type:complete